jgi:GxxExxY protein
MDYKPHYQITDKIIEAFYKVYNKLGYGFLERVYENAMIIELRKLKCNVYSQKKIDVFYDNIKVGEYYADLIVNELVIVELKAIDILNKNYDAQLINYLKASNIEVGILLNFGLSAQFKRRIFSNNKKNERKSV